MKAWSYSRTWYHGSSLMLTTIREGTTITQDRELARIFSHKPALVSISDEGKIKHNGTTSGFLYFISEDIQPDDVYPHPASSMEEGREWLTMRALRVQLIEPTQVRAEERLTEEQVGRMKESVSACGQG